MEMFDKDLRSVQEARDLTRKGKEAADKIAAFSEEQIDQILQSMKTAASKYAVGLAERAVEETGFGKVMDKTYKNHAASHLLYEEIKNEKTIGIIAENPEKGTFDVAEPVGLVLGIIPSTNPTSTVIFKAMIALKSRNAIVLSPHPTAVGCTKKAADLLNRAAVAAGAPDDIISCLSIPTMAGTNELLHAKEVSLIIATGGPGMVKAAYSSGKPALGVGAGNSPAYIERTADVKSAVAKIIASKTFDNGTICASEQSIICEEVNKDSVIRELKAQGGYFMSEVETDKVCKLLFKNGYAMNAKFVGRAATVIAEAAGISVPAETKVLIGPQGGVGQGYPLSFEKLTTVLAFYVVNNWEEACDLSIQLLQNGIGHTMSLHTNDRDIVLKFAAKPASRILVNTGGSQGGTGISTGLPISFTLGCGTFGGSSVSENVGPKHLLNIKKVAYGLKEVTTLVQDDPTFTYGKTEATITTSLPTENKTINDTDVEKLANVVRQVLASMN
ncbi:acetaldehyde dehydrogenase (acetylating) [Enterococcus moraviensis ATCC BAA-383]|uniref:Acetaldehyde dehydrogenase (Acetylating) n=1 Tax=Enterococcus moraviensis ATCC BAA-383 TaxID=1158609 RepID=R2SVG2_9ENTE|nr:acetaldehyde dehydrogenase (acetylating) [Enterococcus moraviensis]EOH99230.1 acetaldehyde dehydrogenase (acetylating) [Enterococcus moraviensis ATCC BAA-383]EOT72087.1 acetaldehyde dehydrogenase (acetylating) [Enterococcus moraviensis ATCC BAA-383]OJG67480.1 acetaldehyde dehydrogenase (acetylating) [Enterococcus moraviensis]